MADASTAWKCSSLPCFPVNFDSVFHKKGTNLIVVDGLAGDIDGHYNLYIRIQWPSGVKHGFCHGVVDDVDRNCRGGMDIK